MPQPATGAGVDVVGRHKRLVRRTVLISAWTAVSRLLGYGRELLAAILFGSNSPAFDAFITAWRIPNLFRRLLGEGAVSTALQTTQTEVEADHGEAAGRELFLGVARLALWILVGLCALIMGGVSLMRDTMPGTGWNWLGKNPQAVRELTLLVTPYLIFICLAGLAAGALAVRGKFRGSSAGAGAMNLVAIATLLWMGWRYGWSGPSPLDGEQGLERHMGMARVFSYGLVFSGLVQLAMLVPELASSGLLGAKKRTSGSPGRKGHPGAAEAEIRPAAGTSSASPMGVLRSSVPLAMGAAIYQVNVMIDGLMAQGLLTEGGPTTYYYANRIQQLPLALVATAATNAVFPALKALAHSGDRAGFFGLHRRTNLGVLCIAMPAAAGLAFLALPISRVLLEHGEFDSQGAARTASALTALALALPAIGAAGLTTRSLYALGDFRTPVVIAGWLLVANVLANLLFVVGLDMDVAGLALATTLAAWANVGLQSFALQKHFPTRSPLNSAPSTAVEIAKLVGASSACGTAAWIAQRALSSWASQGIALAVAIACGIIAYVGSSALIGAPAWGLAKERWRSLRRRPTPP